jgi:hypothetical protein
LALLLVSSFAGLALFGEKLTGVGILSGRVTGIALIALSIACWPGPPFAGMLVYSAAVALYLTYVGFVDGLTGIVLWPAAGLHLILVVLLVRASMILAETKISPWCGKLPSTSSRRLPSLGGPIDPDQ